MAFKPMKTSHVTDPSPSVWVPPNLSGGINLTDLPQNILDIQCSELLNMWFKEKVPTKRYGQEYYSTGTTGIILSMYEKLYNNCMIYTTSTKMFSINKTTGVKTEIYSTLTASKGTFFTFKNKSTGISILFYCNGHEYVQYNGTTVTTVQSNAYIPTVIMGRGHNGGGTVLEQYNALGAGFINSFTTDGTSTTYPLTQIGLDATTTTCTLLAVTKVEGTDYTVNRTTGIMTFTVAPTAGTDVLKVTAYKSNATTLAYILACKYAITFGGNNDTRVFMAGDSTTYYYSGLLDPTYFPENQYNNAGVDNTNITGFGIQCNTLIVFKERSLGTVNYQVNSDGSNPSFPYARMNSAIGCDMPYSIQLINNKLVWCTTYGGVYTLASETDIKDEKAVRPLSHNINGTIARNGLLQESKSDMSIASSMDFYGMYWLCIGSKVYAWDYSVSPFVDSGNIDQDQVKLSWFIFDSISANCWLGVDQDLYYGDKTGNIVHFKNNYTDFGLSINAYVKIKLLNMGLFNWYKYILDLRYSTKTDVFTQVTTEYFWDDGSRVDNKIDSVGSGSWATNWSNYLWSVINYSKTFPKTVKIPNTVNFSAKFSNNIAGQNLSILDIAVTYIQTRLVR